MKVERAKRILIITEKGLHPDKYFIDQSHKLAKGFIRLGHDVDVFSYWNALRVSSPFKSKIIKSLFYKDSTDKLLASYIKGYKPHIIIIEFPRNLDSTSIELMRQVSPDSIYIGRDGDPWPKLQKSNRIKTAQKLDIITATNEGEYLQDYRDAGVPICVFMPNPCDPDVENRYDVGPEWKTDILWTGKAQHSTNTTETLREEILNKLAQQNNCKLYGCYNQPKIGGIDYLYAISGARIGVSINTVNTVRFYHSDRFTHYMSCGTFVLAKRVPDTNLLAEDGQHVKYFDEIDEFFDLAKWYLEHEDERKRIADAGMKLAHERFNCVKIAQYILDLVEKGTYSGPWTKIL
ncbi:MAG: glycosyltransferase family protein [Planctomycetota bacterium]